MEVERRTFVLTDLVGSTEIWDTEPEAMSTALEAHDDLVARIVAESSGDLIRTKGEGDSTFSVFSDPVAAVAAAHRIARSVDSTQWPTQRPLAVRVGVHVGEAQRRGDNWFGSTVNRAARIRGLAPGGAVFVSGDIAALVGPKGAPDADLVMLGRRRLRGLSDRDEIWAVVGNGEAPPILEPDRGDTNVEVPDRDLVGREAEVGTIEELLRRHRLVTLTGTGGSGKTRLAVEVAVRVRPAFADGVWLVDLATVNAEGVWPLVLSTAGVSDSSAAGIAALADRETLIVLDNCEHVIDTSAEVCATLLRAGSGVRILATSRSPLALSSEAICPTHPFPVPPPGTGLRDLETYSAVRLFVARARLSDPSFALHEADVEPIQRCLSALDGVPLAIEIAASHARTTSLARLAEALQRALPSIRPNWRDVTDRHRSLGETIEWSVGLLDAEHRAVLESVSVCRGFDAETVTALTDAGDVDEAIRALVDASLVVPLGHDRFRLLEPVRQQAANRLAERDDADRCAEALAEHVGRRVELLARRIFADPAARDGLHREAGNVEQSLAWLLDHGRVGEAVRLVGNVGTYWFSHDQPAGVRWTGRLDPLLDTIDAAAAAPARLAFGMLRQGIGDDAVTRELYAAMEAFADRGRTRAAATASFFLGRELVLSGDPDSEAAMLRSLELASEAEDPLIVSWSLTWLGYLAAEDDQRAVAGRYYRRALEVSGGAGLGDSMSEALAGLCRLALLDGDPVGAREVVDRAVRSARRSGDNFQLVNQLKHRAETCVQLGDLTQAALDVATAGVLALDVGDEHQIVDTLAVTAVVLDAVGDRSAAIDAVPALARWLTMCHNGRHWIVGRMRVLADDTPADETLWSAERAIAGEPTVARTALKLALDRLSGERS